MTGPRTDTPGPDLGLTPREAQVMNELSTGDSRKAVARRLGVSHHTVAALCARARFKMKLVNEIRTGRPPAPEAYTSAHVYLYARHMEWLRKQPANPSQVVRDLIDAAIKSTE